MITSEDDFLRYAFIPALKLLKPMYFAVFVFYLFAYTLFYGAVAAKCRASGGNYTRDEDKVTGEVTWSCKK